MIVTMYRIQGKKSLLSIQDGRQKSKMATTKLSFIDISTSDRGDFPRIIEIALLDFTFIFIHQFILNHASAHDFVIIVVYEYCHKGMKCHMKLILYLNLVWINY